MRTTKLVAFVAVLLEMGALLGTSAFYRTTGVSIAPTWTPSEKISLVLTVSHEDQHYIGSSNKAQNQRGGTRSTRRL